MRSQNSTNINNAEFIKRFVEVCGSAKPAEVSRLLNVTYQAAKNYLHGRIPDTKILRIISQRTPYSIHWLLTGEGKKFVRNGRKKDEEILTDQMRAFVRHECLNVINEVLNDRNKTAQQKIVVLQPKQVKGEKGIGKNISLSNKRR